MELGMIGLGRMGANMARRLIARGHHCAVYNRTPEPVAELAKAGAVGTTSLKDLVGRRNAPRTVWIMVPVAAVEGVVAELAPLLQRGDCIIDGGNSPFENAIRR